MQRPEDMTREALIELVRTFLTETEPATSSVTVTGNPSCSKCHKVLTNLIPIIAPNCTFSWPITGMVCAECAAKEKEPAHVADLRAVEVAGIAVLDVNDVLGKTIIDAAKECIFLANLLKVVIRLYWNGKYIMVYRSSTVKDIIELTL